MRGGAESGSVLLASECIEKQVSPCPRCHPRGYANWRAPPTARFSVQPWWRHALAEPRPYFFAQTHALSYPCSTPKRKGCERTRMRPSVEGARAKRDIGQQANGAIKTMPRQHTAPSRHRRHPLAQVGVGAKVTR